MLFSSFLGDSDLPGFCWLLLQMSSSFGVFSSRILLSSPSNSVVVFLSRFCFSGTVVFLYIVFKVVFYAFSLLSSSLVLFCLLLLSSAVIFLLLPLVSSRQGFCCLLLQILLLSSCPDSASLGRLSSSTCNLQRCLLCLQSVVFLSCLVVLHCCLQFYLSSSSVVLFIFSFRCLQLSSVDSVNLVFLVLRTLNVFCRTTSW